MRAAGKTALGCALATLVVMAIHVPHEAWALITVIVLSAPEVGASFQKGTLRLVGTLTGATLGVVMIDLFSQYPAAFALVLFAISMFASYKATGPRSPYAYLIGLVTLLIVAVQALSDPGDAEWIAMARCAEVLLGVMATILVTLSLWPVRASDELRDKLASTIDDCRALLTSTAPAAADDAIVTRLLEARLQHQALLQLARTERDVSGRRFERLSRAVELAASVVDATLAADATHRFAGLPGPALPEAPPGPGPRGLLNELGALAAALRPIPPSRAHPLEDGAPGERPPSTVVAGAAGSAGTQLPPTAGAADGDVHAALSDSLANLAQRIDALGRRTALLGPRPIVPEHAEAESSPLPRSDEWRPDPARLLHALKVALALQIALWLWAIFHLPAGMQAMVTVLIVSQRTLGASQLRSSLRLAGAFFGGTVGILVAAFVIPLISSLAALTLVITPIIFVCMWVNAGSKRYGYGGFQAAFAFILTLIGGPSPMPDPMAPVVRLAGILFGAAIALLVVRSIAPMDAWRGSRAAIAALLEEGGRRLRGLLAPAPTATPATAAASWAATMAALRDQASVHLGELRDGGARSRRLAARLDPLLNLVSRLVALVVALEAHVAGEGGRYAREQAGNEIAALGQAVERASASLAAAVRERQRPSSDEAPARALELLHARLAAVAPAAAGQLARRLAVLGGGLRTCLSLLEAITAAASRAEQPAATIPALAPAAMSG